MAFVTSNSGITKRHAVPVSEMDVLWMTAGLGCDGDTIAVTAATQPSIEDLSLELFRGFPKSNSTIRFSPTKTETSSSGIFGTRPKEALPFILVVEGSIPNEKNKKEGYWATFGTDAKTGQPITTCDWIDQLAPKAWAVVAAGTCATYGGIHAMEGNPTGCMGLADYLGWIGNRARTFPSFAFPDARCSPTISRKSCCIC